MEPLRIFIGFDARETVAYNVLAHSIGRRSSVPASITPISLAQLAGVFSRDRHALQSTDFSFSRFLAPFLCGYRGWCIFMDCDMLMLDDVRRLWELRDDRYAVMVVKHDHQPRESIKFLGAPQTAYGKKNWSSVMMFNNARCQSLTLDYVNSASGLELHQFKWLEGDHLIGELPSRWNHLVAYQAPNADVSLVHYTLGGPYFAGYENCEYAAEWFAERESMLYAQAR
jgi:hypothetical protein